MYLLHLTSWIRNPLGLLRLCGTVVTALFQMWSCLLASVRFVSRNIFICSKEPFAYLRCTFYVGLYLNCQDDATRRPGLLSWCELSRVNMSVTQSCTLLSSLPSPRCCLPLRCLQLGEQQFSLAVYVPENGNASEMEAISYHSSQCWGRKNFSNLTL